MGTNPTRSFVVGVRRVARKFFSPLFLLIVSYTYRYMSRFNNIQDNKFKILLSIREERKQQSMKSKQPKSLYEQIIGIFDKKDSAPRTYNDKIVITQEDMYKDLNEGRD